MRFEFLKEHRGEIGPIKKACGLMKVSKSGFYEYLGRKKSNAQIEREALEGFIVEAFERHKGRYGYRRINRELRKSGISVSEKRVLHIMQKLGLAGKGATRKHRIQKKVEPGDPRLNLVERAFTVGERNRLWVGDITYIPTGEGWLYLAAVIDASRSFQRCLDSHGIVQSVSRPGTPLDNAVAESFFKTLKRELVKGRSYRARDEAKQDIFKYIELYYNRVRMHSTLGYMSPVEYERQYA